MIRNTQHGFLPLKTISLSIIFIIGLNCVILLEHFGNGLILFNEGGFIETVTAQAFIFSGILLLSRLLQKNGIERDLTALFGVTCLLFFVREVDMEKLDVPAIFQFLGADLGRDCLFGLGYAILLVRLYLQTKGTLVSTMKTCLRSVVSITVIIGCVLLLIGALCEKSDFVFAEELFEMNGALLIALGAIIHINTPIFSPKS